MSDVILYKKQKDQLAKAAGKVFEAQAAFAQVLSQIGISPIGKPEKPTAVGDDAPKKKGPKAKKEKEKGGKQAVAKNGSAFAEM